MLVIVLASPDEAVELDTTKAKEEPRYQEQTLL